MTPSLRRSALVLAALFPFVTLAAPAHAGPAKPEQLPFHPWHDLAIEGATPGTINVFIEIPQGTHTKYEISHDTGVLELDRVVHYSGYPLKYGIIPRAAGDDGDPLDVVVLGGDAVAPGTQLTGRIVGVLHKQDGKDYDPKILVVASNSKKWRHVTDIGSFPQSVRDSLTHFFENYKVASGGHVKVLSWGDVADARRLLARSELAYQKLYPTQASKVAGRLAALAKGPLPRARSPRVRPPVVRAPVARAAGKAR